MCNFGGFTRCFSEFLNRVIFGKSNMNDRISLVVICSQWFVTKTSTREYEHFQNCGDIQNTKVKTTDKYITNVAGHSDSLVNRFTADQQNNSRKVMHSVISRVRFHMKPKISLTYSYWLSISPLMPMMAETNLFSMTVPRDLGYVWSR